MASDSARSVRIGIDVTQRERLAELLGQRPKARVLVEASTESEWVAREVLVRTSPEEQASTRRPGNSRAAREL